MCFPVGEFSPKNSGIPASLRSRSRPLPAAPRPWNRSRTSCSILRPPSTGRWSAHLDPARTSGHSGGRHRTACRGPREHGGRKIQKKKEGRVDAPKSSRYLVFFLKKWGFYLFPRFIKVMVFFLQILSSPSQATRASPLWHTSWRGSKQLPRSEGRLHPRPGNKSGGTEAPGGAVRPAKVRCLS